MANQKSTKAGGRDYNMAYKDSTVAGQTLEVCDKDLYHANGGPPPQGGDYAPKISDNPTWARYNDASHMGKK
jgi:hypothetical protein